ncbi:hypothetical protein ACP70R_017804 [Stipagrostis hirtigluma subsp. patula]
MCPKTNSTKTMVEPALIEQETPSSSGGRGGEAGSPPLPPPETVPDWASLPHDVVVEIFSRLRHADILGGAGLACAPWRRAAADEPTLWRRIDLGFDDGDRIDNVTGAARLAMARAAVDRSAGRCESFCGPVDRHVLVYLAAGAPLLRSLHVVYAPWCLPEAFSGRVIAKLRMLERLVLGGGLFLRSTLLELLEHCPRLEVLQAGDCTADRVIGSRLRLRCRRKIKVVSLPAMIQNYCFCRLCHQDRQRGNI